VFSNYKTIALSGTVSIVQTAFAN